MGMWLRAFGRIALLGIAVVCAAPDQGRGQPPGNVQLKEVQIAADAFSLGARIPAWVVPLEISERRRSRQQCFIHRDDVHGSKAATSAPPVKLESKKTTNKPTTWTQDMWKQ
jgi:hypothetical protein